MVIGVPKEIKNNENRVSIIPFGVEDLKKYGHTIIIKFIKSVVKYVNHMIF